MALTPLLLIGGGAAAVYLLTKKPGKLEAFADAIGGIEGLTPSEEAAALQAEQDRIATQAAADGAVETQLALIAVMQSDYDALVQETAEKKARYEGYDKFWESGKRASARKTYHDVKFRMEAKLAELTGAISRLDSLEAAARGA